MRIRVAEVLQLFAAGLTAGQILTEMPGLEAADLWATVQCTALPDQLPLPRRTTS